MLVHSQGKPIPVKAMSRSDPGFRAEVERVHGLLIEELESLYLRHATSYGEVRPLVIH
jgi:hypothetical protein